MVCLRKNFVLLLLFFLNICLGLTVETLSPCRGVTLTVWDVGGQDKLRSLWHHYLQNLDGLVFVIDSTDHQRIALARAELIGIYQHDSMKNVPLVVMVNKQDRPDALSADVVADQLGLNKWTHSLYHVVPCCALNGDGITDGFIKLARLIRKKSKIVRSESF